MGWRPRAARLRIVLSSAGPSSATGMPSVSENRGAARVLQPGPRGEGTVVPGKDARIRRWVARCCLTAASLVTVVLGYRTIFVYQLVPGACPLPAVRQAVNEPLQPGTRLSVLSYNIEGHAALVRSGHLAAIARVILERNPDVVALQEVHRGRWQAR